MIRFIALHFSSLAWHLITSLFWLCSHRQFSGIVRYKKNLRILSDHTMRFVMGHRGHVSIIFYLFNLLASCFYRVPSRASALQQAYKEQISWTSECGEWHFVICLLTVAMSIYWLLSLASPSSSSSISPSSSLFVCHRRRRLCSHRRRYCSLYRLYRTRAMATIKWQKACHSFANEPNETQATPNNQHT